MKKSQSIHLQEKEKIVQQDTIKPLLPLEKTVVVVRKNNLVKKWNSNITQTYIIQKKLGEGSFGQVFLVTHKQLKVKRALKVINKFSKPHANAIDELELLKKLDHPNILKIFQYYETPDKWLIITQFFQGIELFEEIINKNRLSESITAQIILEILKALNYIHGHKIVHRDIKAQNILIRQSEGHYTVKVIDWGLGAIVQEQEMKRKCGTPQYCAPEILSGHYNLQCDMWSLGVLVYIMLSGYMPFKGKDLKETLLKVKSGHIDLSRPIWQDISVDAKVFILKLLEKKPQKRLKAEDALNDPWITEHSKFSLEKFKNESNLEQTLKRIKEFHSQTKFQVVIFNYILNFLQAPKQIQKLKRQFQQLDLNNDGEISYDELLQAYRKIYGVEADLIVDKIFSNIDLDNSGKISFSQFITFATQITTSFSQEQLKQAFKLFDSDNDGLIDKKQVCSLIQYEKSSRSMSEQFEEIVSQIDLNQDGKIDFQEFISHISKAVEKVRERTESTLNIQSEKKEVKEKQSQFSKQKRTFT